MRSLVFLIMLADFLGWPSKNGRSVVWSWKAIFQGHPFILAGIRSWVPKPTLYIKAHLLRKWSFLLQIRSSSWALCFEKEWKAYEEEKKTYPQVKYLKIAQQQSRAQSNISILLSSLSAHIVMREELPEGLGVSIFNSPYLSKKLGSILSDQSFFIHKICSK